MVTTIESPHPTPVDLTAWAVAGLAAAGVPDPAGDAATLRRTSLGERSATEVVEPDAVRRFAALVERRIAREPLAYVVGRCRFRGIEIAVDARVHVPRDDRTGLLVEAALELPPGARVHEVGTGAGAVALALKHERPDLVVSASDVSAAAVDVARLNAERLRLDVPVLVADGLPRGDYDLVLANLPYSALDELAGALPPESTRYQPHVAIVAGVQALDAIRPFVAALPSGQRVGLEHAPEQAESVRRMLAEPRTWRDSAGDERMTVGRAR